MVTSVGLNGCSRAATSGSPVMHDAMLSVDPAAVLLDPHDVDAAMGISGAKVLDQGNTPDDTVDTKPAECHGLDYIAGVIEYAPTGFTAMGWRIVGVDASNNVVQMVAQLPSIAKADEFIDTQTTAWKSCVGIVITNTDKASKRASSDRTTDVHTGPHAVIASQEGIPGQASCQHAQHVLQAVSNIILDVATCGGSAPNPAEAIATALAERIHQST